LAPIIGQSIIGAPLIDSGQREVRELTKRQGIVREVTLLGNTLLVTSHLAGFRNVLLESPS